MSRVALRKSVGSLSAGTRVEILDVSDDDIATVTVRSPIAPVRHYHDERGTQVHSYGEPEYMMLDVPVRDLRFMRFQDTQANVAKTVTEFA